MDKTILEQYEDMKKEYEDTERRIRQTTEELKKYDERYQVQDSVTGGLGGYQHFKIKGFPYPEYERKRTLLMSRKVRLESLKEKLDVKMDEVEQYIDTIEDSRKRLILKLRYVDGLQWREVAKRLGPGNNEDAIRIEITRFLDKA
ncbi:MAG: hypothetical protein ACI4EE_14205 [Lachnospiraceae bacterium]